MDDITSALGRMLAPFHSAVKAVEVYIARREASDLLRLQFAERAGYLVTTLKLAIGAQPLPPANGYMILSCTNSAALGLSVNEQTSSQQWGVGVFVRTGERHDRPRPSYIFSTVVQTVVVAYVVGGADIDDKRAYPLVMDTARRAVGALFEAGANTPPPPSAPSSGAVVAAGSTVVGATAALVAGTTYLVRAQARITGTAAGVVTLSMRHNGVSINLPVIATIPIAGTLDTVFGGDFLFTATAAAAIDMQAVSAVTFAGQVDGSISLSRQTS